jgi:ferredoxin-NADP reductase
MPRTAVEMNVERADMVLGDVKLVRLRWPEGYAPDFKTGQFITLFWPDTPEYKRAYSVCSCAADTGYFEIGVKRDGKMGTRVVDWAKVGDRLLVLPPAGKFLPEFSPGKRMVCLAGGSGVTPFRAFARESALRQLNTPITILYSVRTTADVIFNKEFHQLAARNPNLQFKVTCTRLTPGDPWTGRRGRIDAAWIKDNIIDLPNTVFYACGPTMMVEGTEQLLLNELGVPKEQIKLEKWG